MQILKLKHLFAHDTTPQPVFTSLLSSPDNHIQASIFLRPEAKAIWDHMFTYLTTQALPGEVEREFNGRGFFRVTGNSSIGKSYSMLYLLKKFLDAGKLIFFDNRKDKKIYAFIPIVNRLMEPKIKRWHHTTHTSQTSKTSALKRALHSYLRIIQKKICHRFCGTQRKKTNRTLRLVIYDSAALAWLSP